MTTNIPNLSYIIDEFKTGLELSRELNEDISGARITFKNKVGSTLEVIIEADNPELLAGFNPINIRDIGGRYFYMDDIDSKSSEGLSLKEKEKIADNAKRYIFYREEKDGKVVYKILEYIENPRNNCLNIFKNGDLIAKSSIGLDFVIKNGKIEYIVDTNKDYYLYGENISLRYLSSLKFALSQGNIKNVYGNKRRLEIIQEEIDRIEENHKRDIILQTIKSLDKNSPIGKYINNFSEYMNSHLVGRNEGEWCFYYKRSEVPGTLDLRSSMGDNYDKCIKDIIAFLDTNPNGIKRIAFWKPSNHLNRYPLIISPGDTFEEVIQRRTELESREENEKQEETRNILNPIVQPIISSIIESLEKSNFELLLKHIRHISSFRSYDGYEQSGGEQSEYIRNALGKLPIYSRQNPYTISARLEYYFSDEDVNRIIEAFKKAGFEESNLGTIPTHERTLAQEKTYQLLKSIGSEKRPPKF